MYEVLEKLLKERGITAYRLAQETGISTATLTGWKKGRYTPKRDKLQKIADYFGVTVEYLVGAESEDFSKVAEEKAYYELNPNDEKDIAKDLERVLNDLDTNSSLAFMGAPIDERDRELLRISLENTMRMAKEMAKKKYTPKKYR